MIVVLVAACSSGSGGETDAVGDLTRVSEVGGITVEAAWFTAKDRNREDSDLADYPQDDFVVLELRLDTHAGDLNSMDMVADASLNQGGATVAPEAWVSKSDDSHHRSGLLVFRRQLESGPVSLLLVIEDQEVALLWEETPAT